MFLFLYFLFCVVYFVFRILVVKRDRGSEVAVREVRSTDTNAPHQLHCWPAQKIKSTDPAIKKKGHKKRSMLAARINTAGLADGVCCHTLSPN